jgi:TPR repeat protein
VQTATAASEPSSASTLSLEELRHAADAGDAEAQYQLALRYASGDGVERSVRQATTYFRLAARQGHRLAADGMRDLLNNAR